MNQMILSTIYQSDLIKLALACLEIKKTLTFSEVKVFFVVHFLIDLTQLYIKGVDKRGHVYLSAPLTLLERDLR